MSERFEIRDACGPKLWAYPMRDGTLRISLGYGTEKLSVADATRLRDWLTARLREAPAEYVGMGGDKCGRAGDCDERGTEL
jgi:hypothetical protein